jgi:hypothetical protein
MKSPVNNINEALDDGKAEHTLYIHIQMFNKSAYLRTV